MMAEPQQYSARLGIIAPERFQAALARFGLGTFITVAPITGGLFGQNVFVTSTEGEWVLRGDPHYPWQFPRAHFIEVGPKEKLEVAESLAVTGPTLLKTAVAVGC